MQAVFIIFLIASTCIRSFVQTSGISIQNDKNSHHSSSISLFYEAEAITAFLDDEDTVFDLCYSNRISDTELKIEPYRNYVCLNGHAHNTIKTFLLPNHLDLPPPMA